MVKKKPVKGSKKVSLTFETTNFETAGSVALAGDFNGWDPDATPMKKRKKDNAWTATLRLEPGSELEYRYVVDGRWETDHEVETRPNSFGTLNSLVRV